MTLIIPMLIFVNYVPILHNILMVVSFIKIICLTFYVCLTPINVKAREKFGMYFQFIVEGG